MRMMSRPDAEAGARNNKKLTLTYYSPIKARTTLRSHYISIKTDK